MRDRSMIVIPESGPCCAMARNPSARPNPVNNAERGTPATWHRTGTPCGSLVATSSPLLAVGRHRYLIPIACWARPMNNRSRNGDEEADQRRSAALIGLIIILALAIAGVWLVRELRNKARLEDCLMSGRTNCAPIEEPLRR